MLEHYLEHYQLRSWSVPLTVFAHRQSTFKPRGRSESSWLRFTFTAHGPTLFTQQPGPSVSSRSQYVAVWLFLTSPHLILSPLICIFQDHAGLYLTQAKFLRKYHEMVPKETGNSCKFANCTSVPDLLIDADQPATTNDDCFVIMPLVDWLGIKKSNNSSVGPHSVD